MKRFHASHFLQLTRVAAIFDNAVVPSSKPVEGFTAEMLELLKGFRSDCFEMGLRASTATLDKLLRALSSPAPPSHGVIRPLFQELQGRLVDEMSSTVYLSLSLTEATHFETWWEGWESALERFPDSFRDIEEMRKCYALARYSAAIFHSVNVVEIGLIELGSFLAISDPKSGWTAVSNALSNTVKRKYADRSPFERNNFDFLEQVHGTVEALKNAWRNKISHAQGRLLVLPGSFTPEIAEEILLATRSFMRRLADGLPPGGTP